MIEEKHTSFTLSKTKNTFQLKCIETYTSEQVASFFKFVFVVGKAFRFTLE